MPESELSSDSSLVKKADGLYKKLGGVGNADARIVRALLERWTAKEKEIVTLTQVIRGLHNDIGLAHEAAHERLKQIGIKAD